MTKSESIFISSAPTFPRQHLCLEGTQTWPASSTGNSKMSINISSLVTTGQMILSEENQSTRRKEMSHCHFVHHRSHMHWHAIEPAANHLVIKTSQ